MWPAPVRCSKWCRRQAPAFQPNLDAFEQMIGEKTTCVLINTPNNPTGVSIRPRPSPGWPTS